MIPVTASGLLSPIRNDFRVEPGVSPENNWVFPVPRKKQIPPNPLPKSPHKEPTQKKPRDLKRSKWGQKECKVLALHMADLSLIRDTAYGPLSTIGMIPETEPGVSSKHCQVRPQNKTSKKETNKTGIMAKVNYNLEKKYINKISWEVTVPSCASRLIWGLEPLASNDFHRSASLYGHSEDKHDEHTMVKIWQKGRNVGVTFFLAGFELETLAQNVEAALC